MKQTMVLKSLCIVMLLCMTALTVSAQWSVGVKGGWDYTTITRSDAGRIDESYSGFSGFDAGIQAESFHPDCIVVDYSIGRTEAMQICQNLRRNAEFTDIILIALLPDDGSANAVDRSLINETFRKPFDASLLAERLKTLVGVRKELV